MFPGPNATVYFNEAGEPLGWSDESSYEPEYDDRDYDDECDEEDDDEQDEPAIDGPLYRQFVTIAGKPGVAWFVDADDWCGAIDAHMVGDDRRFTFDADDATIVMIDDFCQECGSPECGHGR